MHLVSDENLNKIDKNMDGLTHSMNTFQPSMQTLQKDMTSLKLAGNHAQHHLLRRMKDLENPVQRIATKTSDIDDNLKEEDRLKFFELLTMLILRNEEFEDWMKASTSSILWLHGIPGSGKIMLVCHVIEYLRNRSQQHPDPAPIAYFYCARNVNEPEGADLNELPRNILEQLCALDVETPIRKPVSNAYLNRKKEARGRKPEKLYFDSTSTIDLLYEMTINLLPKELNFNLYWNSAHCIAFHKDEANFHAARRISKNKAKRRKLGTQATKYCVRPIMNLATDTNLLDSPPIGPRIIYARACHIPYC
ncbi:hypothetical protein NHQ30_009929 [Ciborinia camelliae]|nr:hypothetical protein NHQ30_009929 [Ciborinia camelliae]